MKAMRGFGVLFAMVVLHAPLGAQRGIPVWRATPEWRIDGTESGEPFFDVRDFLAGKDGALWVLDFKDQSIRRFDANGKPIGTTGRKGSGPGELRNANGMVMRRDGNVWVNDPSNGRLTEYGVDGSFVQQHTVASRGYGYRWDAWLDRANGEFIEPFINQSVGARQSGMDWRRWSLAGAIRDTFPVPTCPGPTVQPRLSIRAETKGKGNMYASYPFATGGGSAADGNGGVWCATPASTNVVLVRIGKNDTIAQTRTTLPQIVVGKAERDEAVARIQKQIAAYATNDFDASKIPSNKSAITMLTVDDDGRLWVQHAPTFGDTTVTFDVHDKAGAHLGRVTFPKRPSIEGLPIRARGNDVWIALRDADDVVGISKYRIVR